MTGNSEKIGDICIECPVRLGLEHGASSQPVMLGDEVGVSYTEARYQLGYDTPATAYALTDLGGNQLTGPHPRVVVSSEIPRDEVDSRFKACEAPGPNSFKIPVINKKVHLGKKCMALVYLDEEKHWPLANAGQGDSEQA